MFKPSRIPSGCFTIKVLQNLAGLGMLEGFVVEFSERVNAS
jgi:hypothetical protein